MEMTLHSIAYPRNPSAKRDRRTTNRKQVGVPGRIIWHDSRGTPRFSSVVTRDVSDCAMYVECLSGPPIPLHRLVYLQIDRTTRGFDFLPAALKQGKVLSAVCRIGAVSNVTGLPDGYALRLLLEPRRDAIATMHQPIAPANESLAMLA